MKVVKVRDLEYTGNPMYDVVETPIPLKEGDIVIAFQEALEETTLMICVRDSMDIKPEILGYLDVVGEYTLPLAKVVGKYKLERFEK